MTPVAGPVEAPPEVVREYVAAGWWGTSSLAEHVAGHAAARPAADAFRGWDGSRLSWAEYHRGSEALAATLVARGLERGARVAVLMPDGPLVHLVYLALEKAGLVVVGIGPRAGRREIVHLLATTGACAVVTAEEHFGVGADELLAGVRDAVPSLREYLVVTAAWAPLALQVRRDGVALAVPSPAERSALLRERGIGPDSLFLVNSTSGTTGLPKCVMHHQNRWVYFHRMASAAAGGFGEDDVVMSLIPAPFGFGIWTAHVTPAICGATTVLLPRFRTEDAVEAVARFGVTVLAAVSTQFVMMLGSPHFGRERGALRCLFTGGEMVPHARALEFEERSGARVLQVYGSNETGALSRTTMDDPPEVRLRTAGHVLPEMQVRLLDESGADVTSGGGPGEPACRGPATCLGYWGDGEANRGLFTAGGWMRTGDAATIDAAGVLTVLGRRSDIVIRGGHNVSAAEMEAECALHPAVAAVAVVGVPDPVYGETVCACLVLREGAALDLAGLRAFLVDRGNARQACPEHLLVLPALPLSSGGKVARAELRAAAIAEFGLVER
jgi:acyl-CoA synthetase